MDMTLGDVMEQTHTLSSQHLTLSYVLSCADFLGVKSQVSLWPSFSSHGLSVLKNGLTF